MGGGGVQRRVGRLLGVPFGRISGICTGRVCEARFGASLVAGAGLGAVKLLLDERVEAVLGAEVGDAGICAYAGAGDNDHLLGFGHEAGDIVEEVATSRGDLKGGHCPGRRTSEQEGRRVRGPALGIGPGSQWLREQVRRRSVLKRRTLQSGDASWELLCARAWCFACAVDQVLVRGGGWGNVWVAVEVEWRRVSRGGSILACEKPKDAR